MLCTWAFPLSFVSKSLWVLCRYLARVFFGCCCTREERVSRFRFLAAAPKGGGGSYFPNSQKSHLWLGPFFVIFFWFSIRDWRWSGQAKPSCTYRKESSWSLLLSHGFLNSCYWQPWSRFSFKLWTLGDWGFKYNVWESSSDFGWSSNVGSRKQQPKKRRRQKIWRCFLLLGSRTLINCRSLQSVSMRAFKGSLILWRTEKE